MERVNFSPKVAFETRARKQTFFRPSTAAPVFDQRSLIVYPLFRFLFCGPREVERQFTGNVLPHPRVALWQKIILHG
jgi:hypothetical protein